MCVERNDRNKIVICDRYMLQIFECGITESLLPRISHSKNTVLYSGQFRLGLYCEVAKEVYLNRFDDVKEE